jgi:transcriptional regulator with XRE-family HTH domain
MTFGEKIRTLRLQNGYSQEQLAEMTGVTKRTVRNWETGGKYPRSQALYEKLAAALSCSEEYLRGEQELFLTKAAEEFGTRGQRQAQAFLDSTRAMFAGGDLSPEDIDMIGRHFMEMFWEAKENARKYTPRKYRNDDADDAESAADKEQGTV